MSKHTWCPGFYIWWPSFLQLPPREHSLATWLWKPQPCVPGSYGTVKIKDSVLGRLPFSGHCTDSWLKHISSLWERELLPCLKPWACGAGFWSGALTGTIQRLPGNRGRGTQSLHSLSTSLQLTRIFRNQLIPSLGPNFSVYCQGTSLYHQKASTNNKIIGPQTQRLSYCRN